MDHVKTDDTHAHDRPIHNPASKTGSFIRHFLKTLLAMMAGMAIFHLLENLIPASSSYAVAFESDTNLYDLTMTHSVANCKWSFCGLPGLLRSRGAMDEKTFLR